MVDELLRGGIFDREAVMELEPLLREILARDQVASRTREEPALRGLLECSVLTGKAETRAQGFSCPHAVVPTCLTITEGSYSGKRRGRRVVFLLLGKCHKVARTGMSVVPTSPFTLFCTGMARFS